MTTLFIMADTARAEFTKDLTEIGANYQVNDNGIAVTYGSATDYLLIKVLADYANNLERYTTTK